MEAIQKDVLLCCSLLKQHYLPYIRIKLIKSILVTLELN